MNVENMLKLIKTLENVRDMPGNFFSGMVGETANALGKMPKGQYFHMGTWDVRDDEGCKTAACIGGWCAIIGADQFGGDYIEKSCAWLGLNSDFYGYMFYRSSWPPKYRGIAKEKGDRAGAIAMLKDMVCKELERKKEESLK